MKTDFVLLDHLKRQANGGPERLLGHAEGDPALTSAQSDVNVDRMWARHGQDAL
jgi:hypothetical protein